MKSDYYAVVAQILPVLFLAAAVEFRLLAPTEQDARDVRLQRWDFIATNIVVSVGFVLTVSIGEVAALRAVAAPDELRYADELIVAALLASAITLLLVPVMKLLEVVARVMRAESKDQAAKEGKPYTPRSNRADEWATIVSILVGFAVLATPIYGVLLVVVSGLL